MVKSVYITDGIANVDETDTFNQKTTVGRRLHLTEDQSEKTTLGRRSIRRLHSGEDQSEDYTRQKICLFRLIILGKLYKFRIYDFNKSSTTNFIVQGS